MSVGNRFKSVLYGRELIDACLYDESQSQLAASLEENRVLQKQLGERWTDISALKETVERLKSLLAAPLSPDHSGGGAVVVLPTLDRNTINTWMLECGWQNSALRQADLPNVAGVLKLAIDKVKELNQ